jgi:hypothetical protein
VVKSKYLEHLTLSGTTPVHDILPSDQIKLLGVVVDDTLNFIVHAQHASSKGMQALGSLLYLRKGLNEYYLISLDILQHRKSYPRCSGPHLFGGTVLIAFYTHLKWHIIKLHDGLQVYLPLPELQNYYGVRICPR